MKSILASLVFLSVSAAQAYFIAVPRDQGAIDFNRPTHVLAPGRGTNLELQPQETALGRALLYKRNFPSEQVVLLSVFEDQNNEAHLIRGGWRIVEKNDVILNTKSVVAELTKFSKIKSLEFFGHNSAHRGTQMDGLDHANPDRFDPREPIVATLASHFTKDAFAIFHGCNSGWIVAQDLSKKWGIAVAGSLTETRFERLHSDGHYYVDDPKFAPTTEWATHNNDIGGVSCAEGGCKRMRPESRRYIGSWGDFDGPLLTHFKFFCQHEVKSCEKTMALSLYGFLAEKSLSPQSGYEDFKSVAKQFLCPITKDRVLTKDCYKQLDLIEQGRGNMEIAYIERNKQLVCNLKGCMAKVVCDDKTHKCVLSERVSAKSQTMAREYLHYLNGFKTLQAEGL